MIPRWVHRFYAYLFGYFWLPCPLCREFFGGHEWDGRGLIKESHLHKYGGHINYEGVCKQCLPRARQINLNKFGINGD